MEEIDCGRLTFWPCAYAVFAGGGEPREYVAWTAADLVLRLHAAGEEIPARARIAHAAVIRALPQTMAVGAYAMAPHDIGARPTRDFAAFPQSAPAQALADIFNTAAARMPALLLGPAPGAPEIDLRNPTWEGGPPQDTAARPLLGAVARAAFYDNALQPHDQLPEEERRAWDRVGAVLAGHLGSVVIHAHDKAVAAGNPPKSVAFVGAAVAALRTARDRLRAERPPDFDPLLDRTEERIHLHLEDLADLMASWPI